MKNRLFDHVRHFTGAGIPPSRWSLARLRPRGMAAILFSLMLLAFAVIWRVDILNALFDDASLVHLFKKGGPIMWPLVCASVPALGAVIERVNFLIGEQRKRDPQLMQNFFTAVRQGEMERAAIRRSFTSCAHWATRWRISINRWSMRYYMRRKMS